MISWSEFIDSLKGEVQDKSKNPFFGAFIATWLIRNWEVVFIILNFDDDFHLDAKLYRVKCYFETRPDFDFFITIGITFIVILSGYLFLNAARIISNFSEKVVTPLIYKWTAGISSIVPIDVYEKSLDREKDLRERVSSLMEEILKLRDDLKRSEAYNTQLNKQLDEKIDIEVEEELEKSKKENPEKEQLESSKTSISEINKGPQNQDDLKPYAKAISKSMSTNEQIIFMEIVQKIAEGEVVKNNSNIILEFINNGYMKKVGKDINNFSKFELTPLGKEIFKSFS